MNQPGNHDADLDGELLRQLAAADLPPPPGAPITPAGLHQRARQQLQHRLLTAAAAVTLLGAPLLCWPRPDAPASSPSAGVDAHAELRSLQARLERWQQQFAALPLPAEAAIVQAPTPLEQQRWQHDLAAARTSALLPAPTATRSETRR
jgi:hypothetical protein